MRNSSRKEWADGTTFEHINAGSLQRIADATEKIALNYDALLRDKKLAEDSRDFWRDRADRLARRWSALKGVVTKLKRQNGKL